VKVPIYYGVGVRVRVLFFGRHWVAHHFDADAGLWRTWGELREVRFLSLPLPYM